MKQVNENSAKKAYSIYIKTNPPVENIENSKRGDKTAAITEWHQQRQNIKLNKEKLKRNKSTSVSGSEDITHLYIDLQDKRIEGALQLKKIRNDDDRIDKRTIKVIKSAENNITDAWDTFQNLTYQQVRKIKAILKTNSTLSPYELIKETNHDIQYKESELAKSYRVRNAVFTVKDLVKYNTSKKIQDTAQNQIDRMKNKKCGRAKYLDRVIYRQEIKLQEFLKSSGLEKNDIPAGIYGVGGMLTYVKGKVGCGKIKVTTQISKNEDGFFNGSVFFGNEEKRLKEAQVKEAELNIKSK